MSRKKNQSSLPAVAEFKKEDVPGLLAQVEEQLKALQTKPSVIESVSGKNFPKIGDISKCECISDLRKGYHSLVVTEMADKEFLKAVGEDPGMKKLGAHTVSGLSIKTWKEAITSRIKELNKADQINKLMSIKEKFSKYLSEEDQLRQDVASVMDMLND